MNGPKVSRSIRSLLALGMVASSLALGGAASAQTLTKDARPDNVPAGAVYTLTNSSSANAVAVFDRAANGTLSPRGTYATGGQGTGSGLGSQGALAFSKADKWLFAVNAGSNEISAFSVDPVGLTLFDKVPSGGTRPISLTSAKDVLYVLNAGVPANITGFYINGDGTLTHINGSTRPLSSSSDVGPAQVQFSPNGRLLVVTEKMTNKIDTYTVDKNGVASGPTVHDSAGMTPFGFAFAGRDTIVVSEAFGGAPNASAASSYNLDRMGDPTVVTASSPTHQTAACWVAISKNNRYAYAANTGSGNITGYSIADDGSLSLLDPSGVSGVLGAGSTPIDVAFNNSGRYLYSLGAGLHGIGAFRMESDGSLSPLGTVTGLPVGTVGLLAR